MNGSIVLKFLIQIYYLLLVCIFQLLESLLLLRLYCTHYKLGLHSRGLNFLQLTSYIIIFFLSCIYFSVYLRSLPVSLLQ